MAILVGIDGTGPGNDDKYATAFEKSFVKTICNRFGPDSMYKRGPSASGAGLGRAITAGVAHVHAQRMRDAGGAVLLTGYSRGAAGAVVIAKRLRAENIKVRALMLFDCVDRHLTIDAEIIPDNVENVLHVIRDPRSSSRETFGNDGLQYHPGATNYLPVRQFMCTHGGMGGTPWNAEEAGKQPGDLIFEGFGAGWDGGTNITYEQDAIVSREVWAHCQDFIQTHGFLG